MKRGSCPLLLQPVAGQTDARRVRERLVPFSYKVERHVSYKVEPQASGQPAAGNPCSRRVLLFWRIAANWVLSNSLLAIISSQSGKMDDVSAYGGRSGA